MNEDLDAIAQRYESAPLQVSMSVGRVGLRSARLWLRLPHAVEGTLVLVREHDEERRQEVKVSFDVDPVTDHTQAMQLESLGFTLDPDTRYRLELFAGEIRCTCRFWTPPTARHEGRVCFAIASCHDPFEEDGSTHRPSMAFLRALPDVMDSHEVRHTFLIGDQIYSDQPSAVSLFDGDYFARVAPEGCETVLDASREQVRKLFHARYRSGWKHAEWQGVQGSTATSMLHDDHDLVDNFGTAPEHSEPHWEDFRQGALDAYHDYQGSRDLDSRGAHAGRVVDIGRVRVILVDIRSERRWRNGRIHVLSEGLGFLKQALATSAEASVVAVALPVPVAHVPDWMVEAAKQVEGSAGDAADRWSAEPMRESRNEVLDILRDHLRANPGQRLLLLGGDTHAGAIGELHWPGNDALPGVLQLVSSAVSNEQSVWVRLLSENAPSFVHPMCRDGETEPFAEVRLLTPEGTNPYGALNFGLVEVERRDGRDQVRLSLVGPSNAEPGWKLAARTDWL